jgi:hypothetical protein
MLFFFFRKKKDLRLLTVLRFISSFCLGRRAGASLFNIIHVYANMFTNYHISHALITHTTYLNNQMYTPNKSWVFAKCIPPLNYPHVASVYSYTTFNVLSIYAYIIFIFFFRKNNI